METIMYLFVRVTLKTTLPKIEDAMAQIHKDAICLITDTADVEIGNTHIIAFQTHTDSDGTRY